MNGRRGGEDLAVLIERSADLKRDLVDFACSPRWERSLAAALLEAGLEEIDEADAISTIDRFTLQYRLPDGQTVVDRFVASRPDLTGTDREMLLSWRDPVEGIFEIRGRDGDAIILLNLEEHTRCSAGDAHKPQPAVLLAVLCDRILPMPPRPTPRPIRLTQLQNAKLRGIDSRGASAPCLRLRVADLIRYHSQGRHS